MFSPDGRYVCAGGDDSTARVWEVATGEPLKGDFRHEGQVYAVACSPDGKTLLTGSADRTARLWNIATVSPIGGPLRHEGFVSCVAFSPDGKTALTGSLDRSARHGRWPLEGQLASPCNTTPRYLSRLSATMAQRCLPPRKVGLFTFGTQRPA